MVMELPTRLRLVAAGVFVVSFLGVLLATYRGNHFDDAFITYVFARNLSSGHGISWVPGDAPFYGPTSLAWTMVLAAAARLGIPLIQASSILGAIAWSGVNTVLFLLMAEHASFIVALSAALLSAVTAFGVLVSLGMESGWVTLCVVLSLLLCQRQKYGGAAMAAATAVLIRPEGWLLVAFVAGVHGWRLLSSGSAPSFVEILRTWRLALVVLGLSLTTEALYFGTVVPASVVAKQAFGCDVSGCVSLPSLYDLLAQHMGPFAACAFLVGAAIGSLQLVLGRHPGSLLVLWGVAYATVMMLGRAPNSPWYYTPLVPVLFAAFAYGLGGTTRKNLASPLLNIRRAALVASVIAGLLLGTQRVLTDPFGRDSLADPEKRQLAAAMLDDMHARARSTATVLAFEVGYFGFSIPGRVYDLLGLVTPGFQPCLRGDDPDAVLRNLKPDYVAIIDERQFRGAGCLLGATSLVTTFTPLISIPRAFGDNYVIYARR